MREKSKEFAVAWPRSPCSCVLGEGTAWNMAGSLTYVLRDGATEEVRKWDMSSNSSEPKSNDGIWFLLSLSPTWCVRPLAHVQLVYFARWVACPRSLSNWETVSERRLKSSALFYTYGGHIFSTKFKTYAGQSIFTASGCDRLSESYG